MCGSKSASHITAHSRLLLSFHISSTQEDERLYQISRVPESDAVFFINTPPSSDLLQKCCKMCRRDMGRKQAKGGWKKRMASKEKELCSDRFSQAGLRRVGEKRQNSTGKKDAEKTRTVMALLLLLPFICWPFLSPWLSPCLSFSSFNLIKLSRSNFSLGRARCVTGALRHRCRERKKTRERQREKE